MNFTPRNLYFPMTQATSMNGSCRFEKRFRWLETSEKMKRLNQLVDPLAPSAAGTAFLSGGLYCWNGLNGLYDKATPSELSPLGLFLMGAGSFLSLLGSWVTWGTIATQNKTQEPLEEASPK